MAQALANMEYLDWISKNIKSEHIIFDPNHRVFQIIDRNISWEDFQDLVLVLDKLRFKVPPPDFYNTNISQINFLGYERLFHQYLEDRLMGLNPNKTELILRNKFLLVGRIPKGDISNKKMIRTMVHTFLDSSKDISTQNILKFINLKLGKIYKLYIHKDGWLYINYDGPISYQKSNFSLAINSFRFILKKAIGHQSKDRIEFVVESMKENGLSQELLWKPTTVSTSIQGSIILESYSSGSFACFTGRHRIAAAQYLFKKGMLDDISLNFPRIIHPWDEWPSSNNLSLSCHSKDITVIDY